MVYQLNDHISTLTNARIRTPQQLGEMGSWLSKFIFDPIKSVVSQAASAAPAAVAQPGAPATSPTATPGTNAAGQSLMVPPINYQVPSMFQPGALPSWVIPVGLGALGLVLLMGMSSSPARAYSPPTQMGRRRRR